ncbi:MAG: HEAT repeat domain-containing protein [bacterium]
MKTKYVIAGLVVLTLVVSMNPRANADQSLQQKYDSLFVLASSGEVMFRDLVEPAKDSIAAMGEIVVPFLIEEFATKSARERWAVIHILTRIGSPAVPYLVRALSRPDGLIVERVCWALGDIGDTAAVRDLVAIGGHERWQVRDQAVGALGKIGSPDQGAAEAVASALADSIGQVRKAGAVACGQLALDDAIGDLMMLLDDDFYGARFAAHEALTKLDTERVVEAAAIAIDEASVLAHTIVCDLLARLGTTPARRLLFEQAMTAPFQRHAAAATALIRSRADVAPILTRFFGAREDDRLVRLKLQSASGIPGNYGPQ